MMTPEPPEQPTHTVPEVPLAFQGDPPVTVHPGMAPYAVRIELQIMPRDWDRLQKLVMVDAAPTTMHRVLTSVLRMGLDYFFAPHGTLPANMRPAMIDRVYRRGVAP